MRLRLRFQGWLAVLGFLAGLAIDPPGALAALDKTPAATWKAKPAPFNLHAVMHA